MSIVRTIASVMLAAVVLGCAGASRAAGRTEGGGAVTTRSIDEVLAAHSDSLMALPGVVGTAIGLCDGERCIKVLLADSSAAARIPPRLEGYLVVTEVTGTIRPR